MRVRGFFLTLDAIAALMVTLVLALLVLSMSVPVDYESRDYLYSLSVDVLTVLEKHHDMRDTINGDPTELNDVIHGHGNTLCLNFTIYDQWDSELFSNATCSGFGSDMIVGRRSFVNGTKFYIGDLRVWYQ